MDDEEGVTAINVRCSQLSPQIGDLTGNISRIAAEIASAATDGIDLLVLPELATSGYALTPDEARAHALPADSAVFAHWARLLTDRLVAVIGFCEDGDDAVHNSAVILRRGRAPVIYRKVHLWDTEKLVFTAGTDAPPVVESPFGSIGVLVCYDLEVPEMPRTVALRGADVIAVPTNWPLLDRPSGEHPPEVIQAMAAARASGVAIACCDRASDERGTRWTEGTCIVGADGWIVAEGERPEAAISLHPGRRRISERNHVWDDRRPALYAPLSDSRPGY